MRKVLKIALFMVGTLLFLGACSGCVSTQEWWYGACKEKTEPLVAKLVGEGFVPVTVQNAPGGSPALVLVNPAIKAYRVLFLFVDEADKQYVQVPFLSHGVCVAERNDGLKVKAEIGLSEAIPMSPPPSQRAEEQ